MFGFLLETILSLPTRATGVFRVATECGCGPIKGSESPFATVEGWGGSYFTFSFSFPLYLVMSLTTTCSPSSSPSTTSM